MAMANPHNLEDEERQKEFGLQLTKINVRVADEIYTLNDGEWLHRVGLENELCPLDADGRPADAMEHISFSLGKVQRLEMENARLREELNAANTKADLLMDMLTESTVISQMELEKAQHVYSTKNQKKQNMRRRHRDYVDDTDYDV